MSPIFVRSPEEVAASIESIKKEVAKSVVGYEEQVEDFLMCLLTEGHLLIEGVPGVAKTTLSKAFASVCGLTFRRIQFTQDLLPADITGHYFFNQKSGEFGVRKGPIFTDLLLADEINRAPPKTQSALLEAMQERQVTIEGNTFDLPKLFTVIATLNPIETEGVYPLPEAQIDRFTIKSKMDYLGQEEEIKILRMKSEREAVPEIAITRESIAEMKGDFATVYTHRSIFEYVESISRTTRSIDDLDLGLSPRGAIHLFQTAKAHAYLHGRGYVIPDDVKYMSHKVLDHRLILSPEAELGGLTRASVTDSVLSSVPVPKGEFKSEKSNSE